MRLLRDIRTNRSANGYTECGVTASLASRRSCAIKKGSRQSLCTVITAAGAVGR